MRSRSIIAATLIMAAVFSVQSAAVAEGLKTIALPAPQTDGGKPLMQALKERQSVREFSARELPPQTLSDMLWAARGISRPDSGKLTSPTAMNLQEIDLYVVNADGAYLYDAKENALVPTLSGDIRPMTGKQGFVASAPVNLVYVADFAKMKGMSDSDKEFYAATDTGYISQNVYLYCASAGLSTVVRGWLGRADLAKAMKLRSDQRIILAQTVGYPKE